MQNSTSRVCHSVSAADSHNFYISSMNQMVLLIRAHHSLTIPDNFIYNSLQTEP